MLIVDKSEIIKKILKLKSEKNAVILAHYYQLPEIQDIADFVGDSLALSQQALKTDADIIIFAGVHFMAETAKILNPERKVIIPDLNAGCSLADSCPYDDFKNFINQYPEYKVISYINCSAEIKTVSDVICTSSNALQIVNSFPLNEKLIFTPDKNLGSYINNISGRNMILWNGYCHVHDRLNTETIVKLKINHPDAKLIAHPECKPQVLEIADYIGSTAALLNYVSKSSEKKFIVATESGILHQMKKNCPDKQFFIVPSDSNCSCNDCDFMKIITLDKIYNSLLNEEPEIKLSDEIIEKAYKPIFKMLKLSNSLIK